VKFQLPLQSLATNLGVVGRAVAGKGVRPILANVLLIAAPGEIRLVGTDLEIMAISRLPAEVEVPGQCTIPAKLFQEVVAALPAISDSENARFSQTVDDEGSAPQIELSTGRGKYHLQVQGVEEYPPVPVFEGETFPRFDIASENLHSLLKQVQIAIGSEESNPVQKSVCFSFSEGGLRLIATDSRRLAVGVMPDVKYPPEFEKNFLVPGRAVVEILKLLEDGDRINIGLFNEQLLFISPNFHLLTRLYEGKFPDYNRVLPRESSRVLTLKSKELAQALKAVSPISRYSSGMVHLDVGPNETRVWAESREEGTSEFFLSSSLKGEPINVAFNGKYVQDFLGVVDSEDLMIEMTTPSYPGLFRPGLSAYDFKCVIMPMTVG